MKGIIMKKIIEIIGKKYKIIYKLLLFKKIIKFNKTNNNYKIWKGKIIIIIINIVLFLIKMIIVIITKIF